MNKDKQAEFLKIYETAHPAFERFCRARVYGEMDYKDLINETLLIAFQKFENLRSKDTFLSFLFGISVRILANQNRKKKEYSDSFAYHSIRCADESAKTSIDAEVYMLHRALQLLPENQRESIILFEISGMSIKEISMIQETSESNVKQRLKRGREKLTQIINFESNYKRGDVAV